MYEMACAIKVKDMQKRFKEIIMRYNLISEKDHILVGLSGGADSVCLLSLLMAIKSEYNLEISAAHLNHGVRGEEADRDEEFSRQMAQALNIQFLSKKSYMNEYATEQKLSKEAAGRVLRREFLVDAKESLGANKLALAHNADDQAETVLMRLMRGTGTDGLRGISIRSDYIIRPILPFTRDEIEEYLHENHISYVDDSTNFENDYHRNKLRNLLIPQLEREYNPNIKSALIKLSDIATEDVEYLEMRARESFKLVSEIKENSIVVDVLKLQALHKSIARRVIRIALETLNCELEDVSLENIEDILELSQNISGKALGNIRGIGVRKSYENLIFESNNTRVEKSFYKELKMGNNIVNDAFSIIMESCEGRGTEDAHSIFIPIEFMGVGLIARNRKSADRIRPIGLNGSKKIKDIFIDKKVDRNIRDTVPIIESGTGIIWVSGYTKSEFTRTLSESDKYIKLTLIKNNLED